MPFSNTIDVHHHSVTPVFAAAMKRHGRSEVAGAPLPKWSPEKSLQVMDDNGIRTALLSHAAPGVYFGDVDEAVSLASAINDYSASLRETYPGRFGYFATLPMPFTELACREAERALDTLGADGVVLLGSTEGVFLGDPRLEELMAELNRREAVVFVHPNIHATSQQLDLTETPGWVLEFLCDTTRAALNLILSGATERYPRIRFILSHSGGFLPFIAWRASLTNLMPETAEQVPSGVLAHIQRFYYDTALSPSPYSLGTLLNLVKPDRILYGSDFPFAPAPMTALQKQNLAATLNQLERPELGPALRSNALKLFPSYQLSDEDVIATAPPAALTSGGRLRSALRRPVINLIDRIRRR